MKVWVTRDEPVDGPLCSALRQRGIDVLHEPVIQRCVIDEWDAGCVSELAADDWLVLTSTFAIDAIALSTESRAPCVAVVSERSQVLAEGKGFRVELVAAKHSAESLFSELRQRVSAGCVCYPRSSVAKSPASWGGVDLQCPVLYTTSPRSFDRTVADRADIVAVASPSAVRSVGGISQPFASIGPTTTAALAELGLRPTVEADEPSFASMAEAILRYADASETPDSA